MKILALISDYVSPATNGTRVRNTYLWPEISKLGLELKILGLCYTDATGTRKLPIENSEYFRFEREPLLQRALHSLQYSYHQWPYCQNLALKIDQIVKEWKPDIIHAEELRMSAYLPALRNQNFTGIQTATFHNVESELLTKTGSSSFAFLKPLVEPVHLRNLRKFESDAVKELDLCFAYSKVDKEKYRKLYPNGVWSSTSGGVHIPGINASKAKSNSILMVGSLNYAPNIEGLNWFVSEVLPLLPKEIVITVAGSRANPRLIEYIKENKFLFIDTPADLTPIYAENSISIVPLLNGSGTRGRILESMAHKKLVVSTTIGAEGLGVKNEFGILIGDSPIEFAEKIKRALSDREFRDSVASRGLDFVKSNYSWNRVAESLIHEWKAVVNK